MSVLGTQHNPLHSLLLPIIHIISTAPLRKKKQKKITLRKSRKLTIRKKTQITTVKQEAQNQRDFLFQLVMGFVDPNK